ncbi:MAG: hypothetical protein ACHBMF_05670, partial [Chromatiales bacterium]
MPDRDSPDVSLLGVDKTLASIAGLPAQLPGDPRRQAVSSIHRTVYQAWWSIDAWLRLASADEVIYLEGAEDFDVVRADGAVTVQVKQHTGSISLGNVLTSLCPIRCLLIRYWINDQIGGSTT